MSKKRLSNKKRKNIRKNLTAILIILLLGLGGYIIISNIENNYPEEQPKSEKSILYNELENNNDSLFIKKLEINENVNILHLSEIFYKNQIFWPYIMLANPNISNPLYITKGSIIRIPRIEEGLLDINNEESVNKVKVLGDSLLESNAPKLKVD